MPNSKKNKSTIQEINNSISSYLKGKKKNLKVICVTGEKGGVTKSNVAAWLARVLGESSDVLLADLDYVQLSCFEWGKWRKERGLKPQIEVLPKKSFKSLAEAPELAGKDFVVVDTASNDQEQNKLVSFNSELVLLPTGASMVDMNSQLRFSREIVEAGVKSSRIAFLLNRVGSDAQFKSSFQHLRDHTECHIIHGYIPERTSFSNTFAKGMTYSEVPYTELKQRVNNVMLKIIEFLISKK